MRVKLRLFYGHVLLVKAISVGGLIHRTHVKHRLSPALLWGPYLRSADLILLKPHRRQGDRRYRAGVESPATARRIAARPRLLFCPTHSPAASGR